MTIHLDPVLITAFLLALVRAVAWLFVSPPFNTRIIPTTVKAGIAAAMALCAAPNIAHGEIPLTTGGLVVALLTQVMVGLSLGLITLVLVNAMQAAGALVDLFAGFSLASVYDPMSQSNLAVFGRFYEVLAITLLFTSNAYLILVNGWFRSFDIIPARVIEFSDLADLLTKNVGNFLVAAIEIAGPVLGCLFLAEIMLGVLSRAAPSLNVFSLAFPLRVVVALVVVGLALPLLAPALGNLVHTAVEPLGLGEPMAAGDTSDRTEKPTPKRLREAREKGQVARTPDLATWVGLLATTVLIQVTLTRGARAFTDVLHEMGIVIAHPEPATAIRLAADAAWQGAVVVAPILLGLLAIAFLANVAQVGFRPTTKKLKPDFKRLNLFKGMKRMVSTQSWWELFKAVTKTIVLAVVAWPVFNEALSSLLHGGSGSIFRIAAITAGSALTIVRNISAAGLVIAAADYGYQKHKINKQLRMTRQEVRDEYKQQEGNPEMRRAMRGRAQAISRNQMIRAVSAADVVVVNPTHFAVALKYEADRGAPQVVAKGAGEIALGIRRQAEAKGVPVVHEPVLTRTLFRSCEVGQLIPVELYEVVAQLLAFVFSLRARGRAAGYHEAPAGLSLL